MLNAGEICPNCSQSFSIAYKNCPLCELNEHFDLSEYDEVSELRSAVEDQGVVAELSTSAKNFLRV